MKTQLGWENLQVRRQICRVVIPYKVINCLVDRKIVLRPLVVHPEKFTQMSCRAVAFHSAVLHTWYHHTLEQPLDNCDVCGQCWHLQMQCIRRPGRCILTIHMFVLLLAPCSCCWQILLLHRSTQIYILRRTQPQMCIDDTTDFFSTQINVRHVRNHWFRVQHNCTFFVKMWWTDTF